MLRLPVAEVASNLMPSRAAAEDPSRSTTWKQRFMAKPHVTRTVGPIHFEDLDPHRFEDLVRQLAYDFRRWKSIESTGRGGADDGFDVRAFEEVRMPESVIEDEADAEDVLHPMEGNLWMIQCKREKEVGPKKVATIISGAVAAQAPPHGYILAAPVHFSKAAHDRFREELRSRGVMEFYLWGAGELEDMLFQPKNDHILFAFFGISLATKRRSRAASVRSTVLAKNKLMRVLGDRPDQRILVRDLNDESYPYDSEYPDFDRNPRWKVYKIHSFDPTGLVVTEARHFAYLDREAGEWDCTEVVDEDLSLADYRAAQEAQHLAVKGFWELMPRANRAIRVRCALIRFDNIAYIDDKGDTEFEMPHIYVPYAGKYGPFDGYHEYLKPDAHTQASLDGLTRKAIFPDRFSAPVLGTVHSGPGLALDDVTCAQLQHGSREVTLYGLGSQYDQLKPTDVVPVSPQGSRAADKLFLKVTNVRLVKGSVLLFQGEHSMTVLTNIQRQLARPLKASDKVRVVEAVGIYEWQIDQSRPAA
jgi:hypothetical protein